MGWLSTHVLDTAQGCPAAGMELQLWQWGEEAQQRELILTTTTNQDGRTEQPLLQDEAFQVGSYELIFEVADYFSKTRLVTSDPPFLTQVPIRFCIADAEAHYHVPLLVSPWSYSTYRGS